MSNIAEIYGFKPLMGFLVGIEFEIEAVGNSPHNQFTLDNNITVKEDGSLRNLGWEYITLPISPEEAIRYHNSLYNDRGIKFVVNGDPCSERTSIHVHVNFTDCTRDEVCKFILMYVILEPYFFEKVSPTRFNNIYCVPLYETILNKYYSTYDIEEMVHRWQEYTEYNVKPMEQYGTIEFRHLQGTKDNSLFKDWLYTIEKLYNYMKKPVTIEEIVVKDEALIDMVIYVFPNKFLLPADIIKENLMDGVADVQLALSKPSKTKLKDRLTQKGDKTCAE